MYGYGRKTKNELYTSPLKSFFDQLLMAINNVGEAYEDLIISDYAVVGRVKILIFYQKTSIRFS
jgi:hypothetical protein